MPQQPRTTRARRRGVAALAAGVLALTACTSGSQQQTGQSPDPQATAAPTASLARFYSQKLAWRGCERGRCAELTVPVDYARPDGATIKVAVKKMAATGTRVGSLVVNPGGPGASGVDYVADPDYVLSRKVQKSYDLVGFDPRGVARSAPIRCLGDAQMDQSLAGDPTPDDAAEQQQLLTGNRQIGQACKARGGELLAHVSTVEAAKDMDVLRAALGESRLSYLGKSYGTFLGATYADLFPTKVGRFVLDGVVNPQDTLVESSRGQAIGFERATQAYVRSCVSQGDCPLGGSPADGMARLRELMKQIDANPLPVTGVKGVSRLTEGWASLGLGMAMYAKELWPQLTDALRAATAGDGTGLMQLGALYAERGEDGTYGSNILQVINAVNCLDGSAPSDAGSYAALAADFSKQSPTWGPAIAWGNAVCGQWPVKPTGKAKKITAPGAPTMLIVGTTRDPATPYENSVSLHRAITNSRLISFDGDGHTAYLSSGSRCVDGTVDAYLLKGTIPKADDTRC